MFQDMCKSSAKLHHVIIAYYNDVCLKFNTATKKIFFFTEFKDLLRMISRILSIFSFKMLLANIIIKFQIYLHNGFLEYILPI